MSTSERCDEIVRIIDEALQAYESAMDEGPSGAGRPNRSPAPRPVGPTRWWRQVVGR